MQLLKLELNEESCFPFASPITLTYKRDEDTKLRLHIDFRELNRPVVSEPQPFQLILTLIWDTQWFSTMDINSAFWSIPIRIKDSNKTTIVAQDAHYQ